MNTPFHEDFYIWLKSFPNWQRWYNSEKLYHESLKKEAEIFLITTNRDSGKTTHFNTMAVYNFLNHKEKFGYFVRYDYMVDYFDEKFFGDIGSIFFHGHKMKMKKRLRGKWGDLYIDDELCGHVMPISSSDTLKQYSHLLNDVDCLYMDEFQSETNHYCDNEGIKIRSLHESLSRGGGMVTRYLPFIAMSNNVSIINPLYTLFGISDKLQNSTKFLRVNGVLVQNSLNVYASEELKKSTFNQSCDMTDLYSQYSYNNEFLKDVSTFIEKPDGQGRYRFTLKLNNKTYGVYQYPDYYYISDKADNTNKSTFTDSYMFHDQNTVLGVTGGVKYSLREYFNIGLIRFKNQNCKTALLKYIGYT